METIVALSTPPGEGGIGIVRMSGPDSLQIAANIFIPGGGKGKKESDFKIIPRRLTYGHIIDEEGNIIDEVLICYMPAPHTYTREDIVEINAHGGALLLKTILQLVIKKGARLAEPGEFTRRAYINGRIDLIQAESILSIVKAKSFHALKAAQQNLKGLLSTQIKEISWKLNEILAEIEASLNFYQDDLEDEVTSYEMIMERVKELLSVMGKLQEKSRKGRILQDGLRTVIVGRPNVGKSSLYNYFLGEERAIVTEIPGTTRDLLAEYINLKGIPLRIIDTAGIHKKGEQHPVEKIGIHFSKKAIQEADLLLFLLDASTGITEDDIWIYKNLLDKKEALLFVVNKIDLADKIDINEIKEIFQSDRVVKLSIKTGEGIKKLEETIENYVFSGETGARESILVLQLRQGELISRAKHCLQNAFNSMKNNMPMDVIVIDLKMVQDILAELLGENIQEDLLDNIFNKFCIGK